MGIIKKQKDIKIEGESIFNFIFDYIDIYRKNAVKKINHLIEENFNNIYLVEFNEKLKLFREKLIKIIFNCILKN